MIVGLLLAAGGARRFGSQKLVAPLAGVPLVRHAALVLAASTDVLIVVVGNDAHLVRESLDGLAATIVENSRWADGLSASLRTGVESLPPDAEAIIVALGDQPRIETSTIRSLIARWRERSAQIVATRYRGERGHPVLFDRRVCAELAGLSGDVGARRLIDQAPERVAYVDVDADVPRDVDTRDDLAGLSD